MVGSLHEFTRGTSGVVFLGAGASLDSGLPLGDQAATGIIRACFHAAGLTSILADLQRHRSSATTPWPRFEVVLDFLEEYPPGAFRAMDSGPSTSAPRTNPCYCERLPFEIPKTLGIRSWTECLRPDARCARRVLLCDIAVFSQAWKLRKKSPTWGASARCPTSKPHQSKSRQRAADSRPRTSLLQRRMA